MQSKTALMALVAFFAAVCTLLAGLGIVIELGQDRPNITVAAVVVACMAITAWAYLYSLWEPSAPTVEDEEEEDVAPPVKYNSPWEAYQADQLRMQQAWEARMKADQERSDRWWADIQAQNARIEEEWKKRNGF